VREPLRGAHAAGEAAVMPHAAPVMLGTAGWTVPSQHAQAFPGGGSHLERYSSRFPAVEINSSFYRPHRPDTYRRWAATVPSHFRFAVKIPKEITHLRRLADVEEPLERFLSEAGALGEKLGPLLLQLPPSFAFDEQRVTTFLRRLRGRTNADVACEPRHPSWFSDEVERLLTQFRIARTAADPAVVPAAAEPGGWPGLAYFRLHGSPRMYYSRYAPGCLDALARRLPGAFAVWCIFDNTAEGWATHDALLLQQALNRAGCPARPKADPA
jgi:uncharacterized protein YecE (DUF72 family)